MAQKSCTSSENYLKTLPADVRKRYDQKTSVIQADPYELSVANFSDDFHKWPAKTILSQLNCYFTSSKGHT